MALDAAFYPTLAAYKTLPASWVLLILVSESGLDPTSKNSIGCIGLNQLCPKKDGTYPYGVTDPDAYRAEPASKQLTDVVFPYFDDQVRFLGYVPETPGGVYALNYLPGRAKERGTKPDSILSRYPESYYTSNKGLDFNKDGTITVGDLDLFLYNLSKTTGYKNALAQLQAQDFTIQPPYDSVPSTGQSFANSKTGEILQGLLIGGALVAAGGIAWHAYKSSGRHGSHKFHPGLLRSNPLSQRSAMILGGATAALGIAGGAYLLSRSGSGSTSPNPKSIGPTPLNPRVGLKYFPILDSPGANIHFADDFGIMHNGHPHAGNDLFASFGSLVLSPESGTCTFTQDGIPGGAGCPPPLSFSFKGDSGTTYWATHFSEFIGGNLGDTIRVDAGVEIAKVGNGGNACHTAPHCHFEIHDPNTGAPIDPYPYLQNAVRLTQPIGIAGVSAFNHRLLRS